MANITQIINKLSNEIAENIMENRYSVPKNELDDLKHDDARMMAHKEAWHLIFINLNNL